jgi:hypothetical protein
MNFKTELLAVNAFIAAMPSTWHIQKVETNINSGVPDLNIAMRQGSRPGCEFWLEVKNGPKPDLRPFQIAWWLRRTRAGGTIWLIWFNNGHFTLYRMNREQFDLLEKMDKPNLNLLTIHSQGTTWELLQRNLEFYNA